MDTRQKIFSGPLVGVGCSIIVMENYNAIWVLYGHSIHMGAYNFQNCVTWGLLRNLYNNFNFHFFCFPEKSNYSIAWGV